MVLLKSGLILPIIERSPDGKLYKISYYGKHYWIDKRGQRGGNAKSCSLYPKCFSLNQNARIYEKPDVKSSLVSSSKAKSQLDWFGERRMTTRGSKDKKTWYLVSVAERYGWVSSEFGNLSERACAGSVQQSQRKWFFSIEASQQAAVSGDAYTDIITPIPDPSAVACLQNPLFRSVEDGAGQRFAVQTSHNFNSWLTLRLGLAYEQVKYKVAFLNNPHPDPGVTNCNLIPVNINNLTGGEDTITENNIMVPIGGFYRYEMNRNHSLLFGAEVNPSFSLSSGYSFRFFTGQTLSKQTENLAELAPSQFRVFNNLEIRYVYQLPYSRQEYLGLTVFAKMGLTGEYLLGLGIYL